MASLRALLARASGLVSFGALTWVFCFAHGCTDLRCEGSYVAYGRGENEGAAVGPTSWESTPFEGKWLDFSHERLITFELQEKVGNRRIISVTPYISASDIPSQNNGNFTVASGNLAVIQVVAPGWFTVRNDTCADYYVRVVVELEPEAPVTANADAARGDGGAAHVSAPDAQADAADAADSASDGP